MGADTGPTAVSERTTIDTVTARERFRVGQRVWCELDPARWGIVVGYTLHPGGLVLLVDDREVFTHMSLWR